MPRIKFKLFAVFGTLAFVALAATPVLAVVGSDNGNSNSGSGSQGSTSSGSDSAQGNKLQGENLTKCQNKETNINNLMLRITNRAQLQYNLFGTIAERVQNFYSENGLQLSNYNDLVAAVEAARVRAQNTFRAMEQNGGVFSCDSDDPHAYANQFQNSFSSAINDLQTYKTAVRSLVEAVQSVAEEVSNE